MEEMNKETAEIKQEEIVNNSSVINNPVKVEKIDKNVDNKKDTNNKKKILLFIAIILFIVGIIIIFAVALFGTNNDKKDNGKEENKVGNTQYTNKTFFVYVDIVPAVKLEIEERYNKCTNGECLFEIVVKNYSVIEEDTNEVFKGYKIVEKNELNNVLNDMLKHASNKGVDTSNVDFYSDSEEVGSYLELNTGLYGFYYSEEIDSPEEFYGRESENIGDEDNDIDSIVIKEIKVDNPEILVKNPNANYTYNLTNKDFILVTVKGFYDDVVYLDKYSFIFSIDVKDAEVGTYEFDLDYGVNADIEVELNPDTIEVVVKDKRKVTTTTTTTSTTKGSTTKKSTTTKTTTRDDVEINLNNNVKYFDVTSCGAYLSIKKECITSNIGQLKALYPDYNKDLDSEDYFTDDIKLEEYQLTYYFPGCKKTITNETKNRLSKKQGFYMDFQDVLVKPHWVQFKDDRYVKFEWQIADFTSEDLYYSANCGGGDSSEINYKTLDEATCEKYNLPCARW